MCFGGVGQTVDEFQRGVAMRATVVRIVDGELGQRRFLVGVVATTA